MSAEVLRRAANKIRVDSGVNYERGTMPMRTVNFNRAVADWLDNAAHLWPYDSAPALVVARAYLGESE